MGESLGAVRSHRERNLTRGKEARVPYLLNLLYCVSILLALPWIVYRAIFRGKYREGLAEKLLGRVPVRRGKRKCVWFHAVSVGEVNLLAPLVAQWRKQFPEWDCVLSTTTTTGMAVARQKYPELVTFYCPLDFTWSVWRAMRRMRPTLLVLAELELWPNLVWAARRFGAKVAVVNGRLSQHSFQGYLRIRPFFSQVLKHLDLVAVQNETYAERFLRLGVPADRLHVTGSLKFDGAETDRENRATRRLKRLAGIAADDIVFLAGSTQDPEEAMALETYRSLAERWPKLRLILVPRHPHRFEAVARLLDASGLPWQRRSQLHSADLHCPARILLVDTVGELKAWWGTAQVAFVGGSMGRRGGQNMIEPAAYGAAVCFGPNTHNFRDIVEMLLAEQAACVIRSGEELTAFVRRCLTDTEFAQAMGRRAKSLVSRQLGATHCTVELLGAAVENRLPVPAPHLAARASVHRPTGRL